MTRMAHATGNRNTPSRERRCVPPIGLDAKALRREDAQRKRRLTRLSSSFLCASQRLCDFASKKRTGAENRMLPTVRHALPDVRACHPRILCAYRATARNHSRLTQASTWRRCAST